MAKGFLDASAYGTANTRPKKTAMCHGMANIKGRKN